MDESGSADPEGNPQRPPGVILTPILQELQLRILMAGLIVGILALIASGNTGSLASAPGGRLGRDVEISLKEVVGIERRLRPLQPFEIAGTVPFRRAWVS
jgi:hypothetical protein